MKKSELKKALKKAHISAYQYNLDGTGRDDERLCLVRENDSWVVYYLERGVRTTELTFDNEEDACECFFEMIKS